MGTALLVFVTIAARTEPLVGRDPELAALRGLVAALASGQGAALLVRGEAGIGKSHLLAALAAMAGEAGMRVLHGRAVEGGGAYRAVAEALARPLREPGLVRSRRLSPYRAALSGLVPGEIAGDAVAEARHGPQVDPSIVLGEAVLALLRALQDDARCVVILEDLHWADADTLRLVSYLADAVRDQPVLLAVSARDEHGCSWASAFGAQPAVTTLRLGRLNRDQIAELAVARRGGRPLPDADLDALAARSEGLPFLVREMLDLGGLATSVPPSLAALVAARLAAVPDSARAVIAAASVMSGDPDWRLLAEVTGASDEAVLDGLRQATRVGLLASAAGRLQWRHALTREAVRATLLPPEKAALALRWAEALERRGHRGDRVAAAELFLVAGSGRRAAESMVELARHDAARGALRSADEWLAKAASTGCLTGAVAAERVRVLALLGRTDEALGVGAAALDTGEVVGDQHAELCLRLARAAIAASRWQAAEEYVARADRPVDPRSLVLAADAAFGAGEVARARALALSVADAGEVRAETRCEALMVLARSQTGPDLTDSAASFRRAAHVAAEHGLTPWRIEALFGLGSTELGVGDVRLRSLTLARDLAVRAGMLAHAVQAELLMSEGVLTVDGPRAAATLSRRAVDQAARLQQTSLQAVCELVAAAHAGLAGEPAAMSALLEAAGPRADAPTEVATMTPVVQALPHLLSHDLTRAATLMDQGIPALLRHGSAAPTSYFGLWVLLRTRVADRDAQAREALGQHHSLANVANRAALTYAEAIAAGRAGRADQAASLYARADAQIAHLRWWNRLLRLLALGSAVHDGWGDPVPTLRADLAAHEQAGDLPLARTCRDLLRAAGAPVRTGRGRGSVPPELRRAGITSREADVLGLVAEGLTNSQIAARLFVSPRTAETHVAKLLAKTGASKRSELRAWAIAHGLDPLRPQAGRPQAHSP